MTPREQFRALADAEWSWRLREFPRLATQAGVHAFDDRLERMDGASRHARLQHARSTRSALEAIDVAMLDDTGRIEHAVLQHQVQLQIDEAELGGEQMPIDGDQAFYSYLPDLWREQSLQQAVDVQCYIGRLGAIARYIDDHIELLDEALARGITPPVVVLQGRERALLPLAQAHDARDTPFHQPLQAVWLRWPALADEAARVIESDVLPAYRRLYRYLCERYLPAARTSLAARDLPQGEAFYAARLRGFTTLPLTARQVHDIGLAEVDRIAADMRQLQAACGHRGALATFIAELRTDPKHYPTSAEALLSEAAWIAKRVDGQLCRFFGRLPRQPFGIEPVPDAIAPYYTSGRYVGAAVGGEQPALYWVNTHQLSSRALYALPALTLHEAVPGHHLQFALTAEDTALAAFRRWDGTLSAHTEGWALYAEYLGTEMGIYRTPLEAFGRASYEMWRACRLVVDTGLHMFGWTRAQAQDYLRTHTALSEHEIVNEVDRYIGWPGQALSYKMGEIHLRTLRRSLESAQGAAFNLRHFHDRLLALGPMPLPALDLAMPARPADPAMAAG